MKKMIALLSLSLVISACSKTSSSGSAAGGGGGAGSFADCDQPPTSPAAVVQNPAFCPGGAGTWNNYEVKENSGGTVTSNKVWCGGSIADHPASQSAYDGSMVPGGSTSNGDYKSSSVCVSGSSTDGSGNKTRNIWQLQ